MTFSTKPLHIAILFITHNPDETASSYKAPTALSLLSSHRLPSATDAVTNEAVSTLLPDSSRIDTIPPSTADRPPVPPTGDAPPAPVPDSEGVYLSGGRERVMSPAFGSEQYDAAQREVILRSMGTSTAPPPGGPARSLPQAMAGAAQMKMPDLLAGSVSLLSSVPAAMQQQQQQQRQYSLAMAMNAATGGSQSAAGSPVLKSVENGGPYLSAPLSLSGAGGQSTPSRPPPKHAAAPVGTSATSSMSTNKPGTPLGTKGGRGVAVHSPAGASPASSKKGSPSHGQAVFTTASSASSLAKPAGVGGSGKDTTGLNVSEAAAVGMDVSSADPPHSHGTDKSGQPVFSGKVLKNLHAAGAAAESKEVDRGEAPSKPSGKASSHQGPGRPHSNSHGGSSRDKDDGHVMLQKRHDMLRAKLAAIERREMLAYRAPPLKVPRLKSHWDYVLDEVQWMAIDFRQERRWKKAECRAVSGLCAEVIGASRKLSDPSDNAAISTERQYSLWTTGLERATRGLLYEAVPPNNEKYVELKALCKTQAERMKHALLRGFAGMSRWVEVSGQEVRITRRMHDDKSGHIGVAGDGGGARGKCVAGMTPGDSAHNMAPAAKVKKEPFILTELDLLALDGSINSKFGALHDNFRGQSTVDTALYVRNDMQQITLNDDENRAVEAVLGRCAQGLGCLVYGNHSTGKTIACAAVTTSWVGAHPGDIRPAMIVCSRYRVDAWKYEIRRLHPECSFLILDDELHFGTDKIMSPAAVDSIRQIIAGCHVVFCCNSDFLRRKTEDGSLQSVVGTMRDITWSGVMVDLRSLSGHVGSKASPASRHGPCWDGDGIVCSPSSNSNAPLRSSKAVSENPASLIDPLLLDRLHADKNVHALYSMWIQSVTFAFPDESVARCCVSSEDFLSTSVTLAMTIDSLRTLIASWLCFSLVSVFRDTSPEHASLASERWLQWQSHQYGDKSLLLDGLIPMSRIRLPFAEGTSPVPRLPAVKMEAGPDAMEEAEQEDLKEIGKEGIVCDVPLAMGVPEVVAVPMSPSHSAKYSSILMHLCVHSAFAGVKDVHSPCFEQIAKALIILRRICFHEDLVHASTLDWPASVDRQSILSKKVIMHRPLPLQVPLDSVPLTNSDTGGESQSTPAKGSSVDLADDSDKKSTGAPPTPQPGTPATAASIELSSPVVTQAIGGNPECALHSFCATSQYSADMRIFDTEREVPSCGKFEALLDVIAESRQKVAIVVSTCDEHLLTHRYLRSRKVPHLFAGLPELPYHGEHMLPNWYAAQMAVRHFNEASNERDEGHDIILICSWLFSAYGLDESQRLYSSFWSAQPVSAGVIVSLSSDWLFEMDFSRWLVGMKERKNCTETRRIIRLVYRNTIEELMYDSFLSSTSDLNLRHLDLQEYVVQVGRDLEKNKTALCDDISADVRLRCPLISLQGKRMDDVYNLSLHSCSVRNPLNLGSIFLQNAPIMSPLTVVQQTLQGLFAPPASAAGTLDVSAMEVAKEDDKEGETPPTVAAEGGLCNDIKVEMESVVEADSEPLVPLPPTRMDLAASVKAGREWITMLRHATRKVENEFSAVVSAKSASGKAKTDKKKKFTAASASLQRNRHVACRVTIPIPSVTSTFGVVSKAPSKGHVGATRLHGRSGSMDSKASTSVGLKVRQQCEVSRDTHRFYRLLFELDAVERRKKRSELKLSCGLVVHLAKTLTRLRHSSLDGVESDDPAGEQDRNYYSAIVCSLWNSLHAVRSGVSETIYGPRVDCIVSCQEKENGHLRNLYHHRFSANGLGISPSAHLFRLLNDPSLRPRISVVDTPRGVGDKASKPLGVDLAGVENISAFHGTCAELKRRGELFDPRIYVNPLQTTTGRDIVTCPSWLENVSRVTDLPFIISYGAASMGSMVPVVMYAANGKGSVKARKPLNGKAGSNDASRKKGVSNGAAASDAVEVSSAAAAPIIKATPTPVTEPPSQVPGVGVVGKEVPKNPYPAASMRFHPNGTGWRQFGPSGRAVLELPPPFAGSGAVGSAFLAGLPLGREGKKYRHVGEHRVGGYQASAAGQSAWGFSSNMDTVAPATCTDDRSAYQSVTYDFTKLLSGERSGSRTGGTYITKHQWMHVFSLFVQMKLHGVS